MNVLGIAIIAAFVTATLGGGALYAVYEVWTAALYGFIVFWLFGFIFGGAAATGIEQGGKKKELD